MTRVTIHEAKANLSRLCMKGLIDIGPKFFEPLPDEELRLWEGREDWDFRSIVRH